MPAETTELPARADQAVLAQMFAGPEAFDAVAGDNKALRAAVTSAVDPTALRTKFANIAFLADRYNKPASQIASAYPAFRSDFARKQLGNASLDDAGFHQAVAGMFEQETQTRAMINSKIIPSLFSDLTNVRSFEVAWASAKAAAQESPGWNEAKADVIRHTSRYVWDRMQEISQTLEPDIKQVADYMTGARDFAAAGEERAGIIDLLGDYDAFERRIIMEQAAARAADASREEPSKEGKIARAANRAIPRFARDVGGTLREALRRSIEQLPDEQSQQAVDEDRERTMIASQLDDLIAGRVDPLKGGGMLENGMIGIMESAPHLVAGLGPIGLAIEYAAVKENTRINYAAQGMDSRTADNLAAISAVPETALNFVESRLILRGGSGLTTRAIGNAAKGFAGLAGRTAIGGAVIFGEQFAQEIGQELTAPAIQEIASRFNERVPAPDWEDTFEHLVGAVPQIASTLMIFAAVGAGRVGFREAGRSLDFLRSQDGLRASGYTDAQIDDILAQEDGKAVEAKMREYWDQRETGPDQQTAIAALNEQSDQVMPRGIRVTPLQEGGFQVSDKNGAVLDTVNTPEMAGEVIADHNATQAEAETSPVEVQGLKPEFGNTSAEVQTRHAETFALRDPLPGQIPVEVRSPNGTVTPAYFGGYWEMNAAGTVKRPGIAYPGEAAGKPAWTHGPLRKGDTVITRVPTPEQWDEGVREASEPTGGPQEAPAQADPPKEGVPASSGFIANSKVERWADKVLKERGPGSGALNTLDPQLFGAMAVKGAAIVERGVRDFATWSKEMLNEFGENIRPRLEELYQASREMAGPQTDRAKAVQDSLTKGETGPKAVEAASIWAALNPGRLPQTLAEMRNLLIDRFGQAIRSLVRPIWDSFKRFMAGQFEVETPPEIFDASRPATQAQIDKLVARVRQAKPLRGRQERLYSQERGRRAGLMRRRFGRTSGEGVIGEFRRSAAGELPKVDFEPIGPDFTQAERDALFDHIRTHAVLKDLEFTIGRISESLLAMLDHGALPIRSDIAWFERLFGPKMASTLLGKRALGVRAWETFLDVINIPRTLLSSYDLSASLRQGFTLSVTHPTIANEAMTAQLRAFADRGYAVELDRQFRQGNKAKIRDAAGMDLPGFEGAAELLTHREEMYMSRILQNLGLVKGRNPIAKAVLKPLQLHISGIRASERAFVTYLNKLRVETFDMVDAQLQAANLPEDQLALERRALARFINAATGRGNWRWGNAMLNAVFFSPRFMVSRIEAPLRSVALAGFHRGPLGVEATRTLVSQAFTWFSLWAMAAAANELFDWKVKFGIDPRSTDFLKWRIGENTSMDTGAGYGQVARLVARIVSQTGVDAQGREYTARFSDETKNFLRYKLSPIPSAAVSIQEGRMPSGQEPTALRIAESLTVPISTQTISELLHEHGALGLGLMIPEVFGWGVNVYEPNEPPSPSRGRRRGGSRGNRRGAPTR